MLTLMGYLNRILIVLAIIDQRSWGYFIISKKDELHILNQRIGCYRKILKTRAYA